MERRVEYSKTYNYNQMRKPSQKEGEHNYPISSSTSSWHVLSATGLGEEDFERSQVPTGSLILNRALDTMLTKGTILLNNDGKYHLSFFPFLNNVTNSGL